MNEQTKPENQIDSLDPVTKAESSGAGSKTVAESLIDARKALGLSQEDVAGILYLDVKVIRTIEQSAYEEIPKQVFLKGYLRSIAKVVGLDGPCRAMASREPDRVLITSFGSQVIILVIVSRGRTLAAPQE